MSTLSHIIYPLTPPVRTRAVSKPLKVLALGLPRSGTDSLRQALLILGYSNVFHGFELASTRTNDCILWVPLLQAKYRGDTSTVKTFDFDTVLGDCDCVMDAPPCMLAEELLDFYPHAKVILNRRRDVDAWHRSVSDAVNMLLNSWLLWGLSFFDAQLFWWFWTPTLSFKILADGKFEQSGKQIARDHYDGLETKLKRDGRDYLTRDVTEGWAPLCAFLGRKVPADPFHSGNRSGKEFENNMTKAMGKMLKRATIKAFSVFVLLSGTALAVWWR